MRIRILRIVMNILLVIMLLALLKFNLFLGAFILIIVVFTWLSQSKNTKLNKIRHELQKMNRQLHHLKDLSQIAEAINQFDEHYADSEKAKLNEFFLPAETEIVEE